MLNIYWKLFLDDVRNPPDGSWTVARSSKDAIDFIYARGLPSMISFDHDLGGNDTAVVLLKKLIPEYLEPNTEVPEYIIHSSNTVGVENIRSLMETWKKYIKNYSS